MFRDIGIPGVLLDIENTSCYDLGKEELAYKGGFENQTSLRVELLKKLIKID